MCISHTIVGFAPAHAAHFSVHQGGTIQQSRDTRYRSAANLNGNHRVISIENEDHGSAFPSWSGSNVPALTAAQVEANAQILAWAHKTHGVPLQLCPNSRPTSRGLAYHRQGIDGNFGPFKYGGRVSGGEVWSSSFGKVCPGDRRIDQLPAILARAKQIVNGDDDMPTAAEIVDEWERRWNRDTMGQLPDDRDLTGRNAVVNGARYAWYASTKLNDVRTNQAKQLKELASIRGAMNAEPVDVAALASELVPLLVAPIVAELGDEDGASPDEVEARVERVLRRVLGSLDDA